MQNPIPRSRGPRRPAVRIISIQSRRFVRSLRRITRRIQITWAGEEPSQPLTIVGRTGLGQRPSAPPQAAKIFQHLFKAFPK